MQSYQLFVIALKLNRSNLAIPLDAMDCTSLLDGIRNYFATITAEPVSREQIQQSVILLYNLERWRERMVYTATALLTRNHTAAVRTILESIANVERNARARRLFFVLALGWRRLVRSLHITFGSLIMVATD